MRFAVEYLRELCRQSVFGWDRFWFNPVDPATLGLIRIFAGAMLFYTHLVWMLDLEGFFSHRARISPEFVELLHDSPFAWSYLKWIPSGGILWVAHVLALIVLAMLTLGLASRVVSVLAFIITVSYANRAVGSLFGLDQINALLAMYLMVGPCGAAYSLDRLIARERSRKHEPVQPLVSQPSISANISIRLIQLHMCVIYLFSGCGKLLGETWWDGTAFWGALANYEYQTVDLTWMAGWPLLVNIITHVTIAWELTYCALIWPKLTRPLVVALALPIHLGIAICMGMITFGLAMLIGNLAFVSPNLTRSCIEWSSTNAAPPGKARGNAA